MKQLKASYPVTELCALLNCARSSYYYKPRDKDEAALIAAIEDVMMRWPRYGYRRILAQLHREGIAVGERVVRRLLKVLGGSYQVGRVRICTTDSNHEHWRYPNLLKQVVATYPDHVWIADITYIRFGHRFIYLAVILDLYTRAVRGWAVSRNIDKQLTVTALRMALQQGRPLIFHSDQGSQYAAWEHTELLQAAAVQISMADAGQPTQNAFAERLSVPSKKNTSISLTTIRLMMPVRRLAIGLKLLTIPSVSILRITILHRLSLRLPTFNSKPLSFHPFDLSK